MTRRVLLARLIDRVNDAETEKVCPDSIDGGAGKVRILSCDNPLRKRNAWTNLRPPARFPSIQQAWLDDSFRAGDRQLALFDVLTHLPENAAALALDARVK